MSLLVICLFALKHRHWPAEWDTAVFVLALVTHIFADHPHRSSNHDIELLHMMCMHLPLLALSEDWWLVMLYANQFLQLQRQCGYYTSACCDQEYLCGEDLFGLVHLSIMSRLVYAASSLLNMWVAVWLPTVCILLRISHLLLFAWLLRSTMRAWNTLIDLNKTHSQ